VERECTKKHTFHISSSKVKNTLYLRNASRYLETVFFSKIPIYFYIRNLIFHFRPREQLGMGFSRAGGFSLDLAVYRYLFWSKQDMRGSMRKLSFS
jgi:hypothetical protein